MTSFRTTTALLGALAATAVTAAVPACAGAATITGLTSITLQGTAASALEKQKVTTAAATPAQLVNGRLILPAATGSVASTALVESTGGLTLTRKAGGRARTAKLTGFQVKLGKTRVVRAKVNGKRVDLLTLDLRKGEYTTAAATTSVQVGGTRASLTKAAAAAIARGLGVKTVKTGLFGVVSVNVGAATTTTGAGGTTTPGTSPGAATPVVPAAPKAGSSFPDPGSLTRPATAVDVVGSSLTWNVRASFIRYMSTEVAPAATGGATAGAAVTTPETSTPLVYDYGFTPAGGWFDPATGRSRLLFTGKVTFRYPGHGIDFDVIDPEVEIDGTSSRVVATFTGRGGTPYTGRTVLVNLGPGGLTPSVTGATRTWSQIAGTVPSTATQSIFANFYSSGDPFGSIATSLTTPA